MGPARPLLAACARGRTEATDLPLSWLHLPLHILYGAGEVRLHVACLLSERALDELERLGRKTDLSHWVVNLADPLFGFQRRWRKTVLRGILDRGIAPRQFWTLTRSDDLDEEDVELLARARFSIGIGMESGSPRMLKIMQKGNHPERYLNALRRLARLSREHGLNWAANVIVGHPGETLQSMQETHAFVEELFATASDTCGWVSIDPFRLYPGSAVHEQLEQWEAAHGARFFHPLGGGELV